MFWKLRTGTSKAKSFLCSDIKTRKEGFFCLFPMSVSLRPSYSQKILNTTLCFSVALSANKMKHTPKWRFLQTTFTGKLRTAGISMILLRNKKLTVAWWKSQDFPRILFRLFNGECKEHGVLNVETSINHPAQLAFHILIFITSVVSVQIKRKAVLYNWQSVNNELLFSQRKAVMFCCNGLQ